MVEKWPNAVWCVQHSSRSFSKVFSGTTQNEHAMPMLVRYACGSPNLFCAHVEYLLHNIKPASAELLVGNCLHTIHMLDSKVES